jgi:hypothetical protein
VVVADEPDTAPTEIWLTGGHAMTLPQGWRDRSRSTRVPAGSTRPRNPRAHWAVVGLTLLLVFVAAPVTLLYLQSAV